MLIAHVESSDSLAPRPGTGRDGSLAELYRTWFDACEADTPEMLEEVFRLRYQVYCLEKGFEDPNANPNGIECDEYDGRSLHALLIHRASRAIVGTIRLVLHDPSLDVGSLPFDRVCHKRPSFLPLETTAELSRFAVSKSARRRIGDGPYGRVTSLPGDDAEYRRVIPHTTLGLMTTALQLGLRHNVTHVCAVMEPTLLRLLTRLGIHFTPYGDPVEYHGVRQPCYTSVEDLFARMRVDRPDVWDVVTDCGRSLSAWRFSQAITRNRGRSS
jgi:N-acyl amino acid synthase of PEP-CTERM/exosortase system